MMGAQLVSRVYTSWTHLPDRPFRLLSYMALVSLDDSKQPTFWAGREAMAEALGMPPKSESSHRMVARAVQSLIEAGAIKRKLFGHAGKRAEYALTLKGRKKGDATVTVQDDAAVTLRVTPESGQGDSGVREGCTPESPLGTKRNNTGTHEEPTSSSKVSVPRAMARVATASDSRLAELRMKADREVQR